VIVSIFMKAQATGDNRPTGGDSVATG